MANVNPYSYGRHKNVQQEPLPVQANAGAYGVTAGVSSTVVLSGDTGRGVVIDYIDYGYRVASATGSIQITDGTLTWGPFTIILGGLQTRTFSPPLGPFAKNGAVTVSLGDGGQTKDLFVQAHLEGNVSYFQ